MKIAIDWRLFVKDNRAEFHENSKRTSVDVARSHADKRRAPKTGISYRPPRPFLNARIPLLITGFSWMRIFQQSEHSFL